jgi:myo-inositol-1(or 4)-monophosphatase
MRKPAFADFKSRELTIAVKAALLAGKALLEASPRLRHLRAKTNSGPVVDSRKGFVTEMDRRCERLVTEIVSREFPDFGVLGEEQASDRLDAENVWVIDPIDGTLSYARGLDSYTVAVGLIRRGEPILGVVFQPEKNELFVAEKGLGAFLNGKPIHVSDEKKPETGLVSMDHRIFRIGEYPLATNDLVQKLRRLRVSESCSQELCYLACGRIDGFIRTLQPTDDYAIAKVIVEEAGGVVRDFEGKPIKIQLNRERNTNLLAGNPELVENLVRYMQRK